MALHHLFVRIEHSYVVDVGFLQGMGPKSAVAFHLLLVVSIRVVVEAVDIAAALHEEKVQKSQLIQNKGDLHPLIDVLAALLDVFDVGKVALEGFSGLFFESL